MRAKVELYASTGNIYSKKDKGSSLVVWKINHKSYSDDEIINLKLQEKENLHNVFINQKKLVGLKKKVYLALRKS